MSLIYTLATFNMNIQHFNIMYMVENKGKHNMSTLIFLCWVSSVYLNVCRNNKNCFTTPTF